MGRHGDDTFTGISATGKVDGEWESVGFRMTVSETAKTGPDAKEAVRESADRIAAAIEGLRAEGLSINPEDVRATYAVDKAQEYRGNRQVFAGYTATYVCAFKTTDVEQASQVHDRLTSLAGNIECDSPSFSIAAEETLREAALAKAWEEVTTKLGQLCRTCGVGESQLTLSSFSVGDDRGGGHLEGRAMVASAQSAPLQSANQAVGRQAAGLGDRHGLLREALDSA